MKQKQKLIVGILVLILLLFISGFLYRNLSKGASPAVLPKEEERIKAPDFTVLDASGNEVKLSEFLGKPIVLNFWTSWCGYCKEEMPHFEKLYQEMGDDVVFMMIDSVDGQRETIEKGKEFIAQQNYTFPIYFDDKLEATIGYGINSFPVTLFIDAEGYLVTGAFSMIDEESLRKGISFITEQNTN